MSSVGDVAALHSNDTTFDAHHRLRGQRTIVGARARALTGGFADAVPNDDATTVAIPEFQNLRIYITADFDPGSAISLVFGLHWGWWHRSGQTLTGSTPRVRAVQRKTVDAEWEALHALLDDIDALMVQAERIDPRATMQVLVWDSVTFDHLTRVIGRHLGRILGTDRLKRLAWLFPPEQVLGSGTLASSPAVSVVRDAVTSLISLDLAHTYTLVETARRFHPDRLQNTTFHIPLYWHDPFSDQIPPERAHQFWGHRSGLNVPTHDDLAGSMQTTVRTKLFALGSVHEQLITRLKGRLPRRAPEIRQVRGPRDESGTSHLGLLLLAHAQLDGALSELDVSRTRALPIEEREAKFDTARLPRRLAGQERAAALNGLALDPTDSHLDVFELGAGSTQVNAKEGEFTWVVLPEGVAGRLRDTFGSFVRRAGDAQLLSIWENDFWAMSARLEDIFGVEVLRLDRDGRRVAVKFNTWGSAVPLRTELLDRGHITLDSDLVMDPKSLDVFSRRVKEVVKAIGNPPAAARDTRIKDALGITRNPRTSAAVHVQDFLWSALDTADETVTIDVAALRAELDAHGHTLNPSQLLAWERALTRRLSIIWGPPGTGKTATVRTVLRSLAHASTAAPLRIAVVAASYTAVDNVLRGLRSHFDAAAPDTHIRRVRSAGRAPVAWLHDDENIDSGEPSQMQQLASDIGGPHTIIVGGTPTQLQKVIQETAGGATGAVFDVIVIDEGGQIDVAHSVLALAGAAPGARVIVAGDPKQLPPIHAAESPAGLENLVGSAYDFFTGWHGVTETPLLVNYRSNQDIVDVARMAGYPATLTANTPTARLALTTAGAALHASRNAADPLTGAPVHTALFDIVDPERSVVCVTYDDGESGQWNQFEASLVVRCAALLWDLCGDGDVDRFWTEQVGIVTPHRAQRALIIDGLQRVFATGPNADHVQRLIADAVDTVERFQGQEREVIFASFAVGDPDTVAEEAEFLQGLNRFNVLTTRAKTKLVVVGSRELFDHLDSDLEVLRASELLKNFVDVFCDETAVVTLPGVPADLAAELRWHTSTP